MNMARSEILCLEKTRFSTKLVTYWKLGKLYWMPKLLINQKAVLLLWYFLHLMSIVFYTVVEISHVPNYVPNQ